MKISKLFHVLVVTGASTTVGIGACSSDDTTGSPAGVGNGGTDTGGAGTSAGNGSSGTASNAGGGAGTMSSTVGSGGSASTGGAGGDSSAGGSGGSRAGAGGSGGAAGAGMSGAGGSAGGAATCTIVDSTCGNGAYGYKDYKEGDGCCCWIVAPAKGRCTEVGCPANTACCKGHGQ